MRYVCLLAVMTGILGVSVLSAQDGAAIYKQRCASCHDTPEGRTPPLSAIKEMRGEAIYVALTSGAMKIQAQGLSTAEIFMLLGHIAPTGGTSTDAASLEPTCKNKSAFDAAALSKAMSAPRWNGWSPTFSNARFQDASGAGLRAADISKLKLKWAFNLGDVTTARSQPTVAGGRVFIASVTGVVYALDANSGCTYWGFKTGGMRSGVTLGSANGTPSIFFGDSGATVYAVNADTGQLIWKNRPVDHFTTLATAAPQIHNGVVYQAFSSFEEAIAGDPVYACCTFRGSVVAMDAATGKKIWQTYTIPEAPAPTRKVDAGPQQYGPSGAGIWSTPTIDERLGALYVATGDNYSDPPSKTSDAILAMDLKTGALLWSRQLTENDAFNNSCTTPPMTNCPQAKGPDFDFGQPPILVQLGGQSRALVIAQKSGMVHAIDPDKKGVVLWQKRASTGGYLGGSQWGSASDGRNIYVATSDLGLGGAADPTSPLGFRLTVDPTKGGGLHALDLKTGERVWDAKPPVCPPGRTICSPAQSAAVTVIPGVVFSGSVDGHLRAYSASTGAVLWEIDTAREFETVNGKPARGGSMDVAGPAVVNGMVFVNSGYGQWGGLPGNVMLVFSVDGK